MTLGVRALRKTTNIAKALLQLQEFATPHDSSKTQHSESKTLEDAEDE